MFETVVEYVKDKFYRKPIVSYGENKFAEQDAKALGHLVSDIMRTQATNGHRYWYLFIRDMRDCDVIRFLLRRNGLVPEFHKTKCYGDELPTFRVAVRGMDKNEKAKEFMKAVSKEFSSNIVEQPSVQVYIDSVKQQIKQKVK